MSSARLAGPPSRGWAGGPGTGQDRYPTRHPTRHPTPSIMKLAAVGEIEKAANLMIDRGQARG